MSPMSTTSMAQARIHLHSATAGTMCQQGRQTSPPPSTHTVSTRSAPCFAPTIIKHAAARCFCKGLEIAPAPVSALIVGALSYKGRRFFLVNSIVLVHLKGYLIFVMT